jgi:hypothetical protein
MEGSSGLEPGTVKVSERRIVEYTVAAGKFSHFMQEMAALINAGWQPYGDVQLNKYGWVEITREPAE